jgi:hypothetical protein
MKLNDVKLVFQITSLSWDDSNGRNVTKTTKPVALGEIIDYGMTTQLDFDDGGYIDFKDVDWGKDDVRVEVRTP